MHLIKKLLFVLVVANILPTTIGLAQGPTQTTTEGDAFLRMLEQSTRLYYNDFISEKNTDSIIDALNYEANAIPLFTDEEYCKRLSKLNEISDFGYDCNEISLATIKYFAQNRRSFAKIVLGRSKLYFDMYEEKLAEYGLPLELKYLSVIESGLRPQVKSHAGATGLWQFMYGTGKQYGLVENSFIDERMDPLKATDAACRMLKKLFGIYGDWNLALAAYNAGPGNVNKAIKRSGGKRTFWEIRPYLPRETQGYVPNFIAASYLLTYHAEHNIRPAAAKIHYYHLDTFCLKKSVHMESIEKVIAWKLDDIKSLNPVYKTTYIPATEPKQCITGPLDKIGLLVTSEDSLYAVEDRNFGAAYLAQLALQAQQKRNQDQLVTSQPNLPINKPKSTVITTIKYTYHKVKAGENLSRIAAQYNVTIQNIMEWNNLPNTQITVGALLKIQTLVTTTVESAVSNENPVVITTDTIQKPAPVQQRPAPVRKKYYTVRSGDGFSRIASNHGLTQNQLEELNPGVNPSRIRPGQRLRIK